MQSIHSGGTPRSSASSRRSSDKKHSPSSRLDNMSYQGSSWQPQQQQQQQRPSHHAGAGLGASERRRSRSSNESALQLTPRRDQASPPLVYPGSSSVAPSSRKGSGPGALPGVEQSHQTAMLAPHPNHYYPSRSVVPPAAVHGIDRKLHNPNYNTTPPPPSPPPPPPPPPSSSPSPVVVRSPVQPPPVEVYRQLRVTISQQRSEALQKHYERTVVVGEEPEDNSAAEARTSSYGNSPTRVPTTTTRTNEDARKGSSAVNSPSASSRNDGEVEVASPEMKLLKDRYDRLRVSQFVFASV